MAPRGCKAAKANASHASAKKASAKAKIQQAKTTLAKDELTSKSHPSASRTLRRRTSEQACSKIIKDNFPTFSCRQSDDKVNDAGRTLCEQLRLDRKDPSVKMGLKYYSAMRVVFGDEESPLARLKVLDPSEPINPLVEEAIRGLEALPVSLSALGALFNADTVLSQRNVVALLKGLMKLKTSASVSQLCLVIQGLRWLQDTRMSVTYKAELELCRSFFDGALCKHHDVVTTAGRTTEEWWSLVKDVAKLGFDAVAFEKCVTNTGAWTQVADSLRVLVCSSAIGKRIFGAAYKSIEAENMQALVKTWTGKMAAEASVDKAALARFRSDFIADAESQGVTVSTPFPKTKDLSIVYRDVEVVVIVSSYLELFNISCVACLRGVAVDQGALAPVLCENDLVPTGRPLSALKVHPSLLTEATIARAQVADFASEMEDLSGESLVAMFKSKLGTLRAIDKFMTVECSFFAGMANEVGQRMFKNAVLACMPSDGHQIDWRTSRGKLDALLASAFARFSGKGLLAQAQSIAGWLRSGEAGRCPSVGLVASDLLVQARDRLAFFCVTAGAENKTLMGKPALAAILARLQAAAATNPPSLIDVQPLVVFKFLLDTPARTQLDSWVDAALAGAIGATAAPSSSVVVAEAPTKRRKRGKANGDDCSNKVVASYFS